MNCYTWRRTVSPPSASFIPLLSASTTPSVPSVRSRQETEQNRDKAVRSITERCISFPTISTLSILNHSHAPAYRTYRQIYSLSCSWRPRRQLDPFDRVTPWISMLFITASVQFLSRVSILTRDRPTDIAILSVRPFVYPSVCPSVTFRYSMKTASHIVIVSSPHGSPIILVLYVSNVFTQFRWGHPLWGC